MTHADNPPVAGTFWRRIKDSTEHEVVFVRGDRIQFRKAGATNLKNTRWLSVDGFLARYEPADAPPPLDLGDRLLERFGLPGDYSIAIEVARPVGRIDDWPAEMVAWVKRHGKNASWQWMHVPANGREYQALWVTVRVDGTRVVTHGGVETRAAARELNRRLIEAKEGLDEEWGSQTPAPFAYARAGR
jgi:hypothetical protein